MKVEPIKRRIARALAGKRLTYWQTLHAVFPREQFPNAMRPATKGGPPGCAMAFGRALREMGIPDHSPTGHHGTLSLSDHEAQRWLV